MAALSALDEARVVAADAATRASANDRAGRFPEEGAAELAKRGLLGLLVPKELGGRGEGPRAFAEVVATLAEADASLAMVYVMHVSATAVVAAAPRTPVTERVLRDVAGGRHLTTLAFSERGSRSHFWAPVSRARRNGSGVYLFAEKSWVTSANRADSYVVTTLAAEDGGPVASTLYLVPREAAGVAVAGPWEGMGLRGNDSAPVKLSDVHVGADHRLTAEGKGLDAKLGVVLPLFNLGVAAMSLGICRAAVAATAAHLGGARLAHMGGASLGETYPTLRASLASMRIETDGLAARVEDTVRSLESPGAETTLKVLAVKAAGNEAAIRVTGEAMHACGGAAFSGHTSVDRLFRDAHAGAVMAPTVDQLKEFVGRAVLGLPLLG